MAKTYRVLLYSHDSQGLGHVRRNLAIAHNLARRLPGAIDADVAGLLVTGLAPASRFPLPEGFDWVTIPGVSKGRDGYRPRSLSGATGDLIKLRSRLLQAALLGFKPDLVIIDRHIYGVWSELREPLMWLREQHPTVRVVLGLREVLDDPRVAAAEWERLGDPDRLRDLVDEVWVYGDPAVHDSVATGEAPPALADRIRFTGYLANDRRVSDHGEPIEPKPFVLTPAGGGSDGHELLRAAVAMRAPVGYENIVVTGPQLDDASFEAIAVQAAPGTQVHRSWPGLGSQIAEAAAGLLRHAQTLLQALEENAADQGPQLDLFATETLQDSTVASDVPASDTQECENGGEPFSSLRADAAAQQVLDELRALDLDAITPRQAAEQLHRWREVLQPSGS